MHRLCTPLDHAASRPARPTHRTASQIITALLAAVVLLGTGVQALAASAGGKGHVFNSRPTEKTRKDLGHLGPTGVEAFLHPGFKITVEGVAAGSPAEGLFEKGDVLHGVNGEAFADHNVFVLMGDAITRAEATDGKVVFQVQMPGAPRDVSVTIPVLGSYSKTWPIDCPKSEKIVEQAAAYYHDALKTDRDGGIPNALKCLFLLSTGDDAHLRVVRSHLESFIKNPAGIGDHTWNNGYNGILCAEYYLRTGDKDVLPVLQAFADDAKERQKFDAAWTHWSNGINPRYVAGGLMNAASVQVLTTLLLAKECGVDVDEKTLNNSLKFFYRFVGHGCVPYGDHRGEGSLGSNGKDGMLAAAMQVAMGASGDTSIYRSARDYSAMATLKSYPSLATGHGDWGRGDGIWRGLSAELLREQKPNDYRTMMDRLTWWLDLSRFHNGAVGMATVNGHNDPGSGAAVAMTYTAHRKHLRILGAPRSEHAVDFELPEHLWGRPADLVFHGIDFLPEYKKLGDEVPPHTIMNMLGNAYSTGDTELAAANPDAVMQTLYHHRYMFRTQAAKALLKQGKTDVIEQLLRADDPRLRRAGCDAITDWRYWFDMGKQPMSPDQATPAMAKALAHMITDPDEALYVVEGALFAMSRMPAAVIAEHAKAIRAWTTHDEWWLRQGAFMALQGLEPDTSLYLEALPTLLRVYTDEYHTQPRQGMANVLARTMRQHGPDSEIGRTILAGFKQAAQDSKIKPDPRTREGSYNVVQAVQQAIKFDAAAAVPVADVVRQRFDVLDTERLMEIVAFNKTGDAGLYPILGKLKGEARQALTDTLTDYYLPELTKRLKAQTGTNLGLIDTVLALKELKGDVDGWQPLGKTPPAQREWRFTTLDPSNEADTKPRRERKRFRDITLPDHLAGWYEPGFDDSAWNRGKAPIGDGVLEKRGVSFPNQSDWGDGEFLLARVQFEVDSLDHDLYRLSILNNQGFHIYLNGTKINSYIWWNDNPRYWKRNLSQQHVKLLKKGTNTLAVYANAEYPSEMNPRRWKRERLAQFDCWIEGLRTEDLY